MAIGMVLLSVTNRGMVILEVLPRGTVIITVNQKKN